MRKLLSASFAGLALGASFCITVAQAQMDPAPPAGQAALTPQAINAARLGDVAVEYAPGSNVPAQPSASGMSSSNLPVQSVGFVVASDPTQERPSPAIVRLQVLLDRAGASPGVIDGLDGQNVRHAVEAFEAMNHLGVDGKVGPEVIATLDAPGQVIGTYVIAPEDAAVVMPSIPKDYAEQAQMPFLGYTSVAEGLAERFHMGLAFLKALNPDAKFEVGETIFAADLGPDKKGRAARVDVDKAHDQVRAYDDAGTLIAAYPATIGSESDPSPSGTHVIQAVVENPTYTYNPKLNFQQGDNDQVLTLPPGPNGPVGIVWIDLSEPTFGIHGTPSPAQISRSGSHGCVRLTNWDARELAKLVGRGVPVNFLP